MKTLTAATPWPEVLAAAADGVILDVPQQSGLWHRARLGIPTSSEFGKIAKLDGTPRTGQMPQTYLNELLAERFLGLDAHPDSRDTFWQAHGREAEGHGVSAYELMNDCEASEVGIILNHGCGASPDRMIDGEIPMEVKSPKASTHIGYLRNPGKLPNDYVMQVHGHMAVLDAPRAVFMSYCAGLPDFVVEVERSEVTEALVETLELFVAELDAWCTTLGAPALEDVPWVDAVADGEGVLG